MDEQEYIASIYDFIKANEIKIECDYYDEEGHVEEVLKETELKFELEKN